MSRQSPDLADRFAFDGTRHDRAGNRRVDRDWHAEAIYLVVGGEHLATVDGPALRWFSADDAPEGERILLGVQHGVTYAAIMVERVPNDLGPTSVRTLAPMLAADPLSLAIHAVGMARWLQSTPFCARCGGSTTITAAGHLRECPLCGAKHFPRTDPAVIMAITYTLDGEDRLLLGRNSEWPEGRFSTLAGFVEPGESLEDAVRREVLEEVGVTVGEVSYAGSQPWPFPASIMLGFFGEATSPDITIDHDEIAEARWFTRREFIAAQSDGTVKLPPPGISISSWLIEKWAGQAISGTWF